MRLLVLLFTIGCIPIQVQQWPPHNGITVHQQYIEYMQLWPFTSYKY